MQNTTNDEIKKYYESTLPSVLISDIYNEAQLIFSILQDKDRHTISYLDTLTLLRGIGMNPVTRDMDYLRDVMAGPVEKLDAQYREEEARKEKERREEERKKGKKSVFIKKKGSENKTDPKAKGGTSEGKEGEKKLRDPPEEIKNIDWAIFITAVEPIFRDTHREQDEILQALRVFDPQGTGKMKRDELIKIVTSNGESVLDPHEVKQVCELIPEQFELIEFAQRVQGTYVPPSAEEIAEREEAERLLREKRMAQKRAEEEANADPLAQLIGSSGSPATGGDSPEEAAQLASVS